MNSNGKGSADRTTNHKAFAENFSHIDWGTKAENGSAWDAVLSDGGPGEIRYRQGETPPIIPDGWRKLELDEVTQPGDYWEYYWEYGRTEAGEMWQAVHSTDRTALSFDPLTVIRKVDVAAAPLKEIFPADDVTDIAERNPS